MRDQVVIASLEAPPSPVLNGEDLTQLRGQRFLGPYRGPEYIREGMRGLLHVRRREQFSLGFLVGGIVLEPAWSPVWRTNRSHHGLIKRIIGWEGTRLGGDEEEGLPELRAPHPSPV